MPVAARGELRSAAARGDPGINDWETTRNDEAAKKRAEMLYMRTRGCTRKRPRKRLGRPVQRRGGPETNHWPGPSSHTSHVSPGELLRPPWRRPARGRRSPWSSRSAHGAEPRFRESGRSLRPGGALEKRPRKRPGRPVQRRGGPETIIGRPVVSHQRVRLTPHLADTRAPPFRTPNSGGGMSDSGLNLRMR
jgi:hypothetical protein